jgi:hypothetical protein
VGGGRGRDGGGGGGGAGELRYAGAPTRTALLAEAAALGVSAARLVWAGRLPKARHLGRLRLADVFLDGAQYSAHTIAADSLWAGLPLLSMPGPAFSSRVSASMSLAAGVATLPLPQAAVSRDTPPSPPPPPAQSRAQALAKRQRLPMVSSSWKEYTDTGATLAHSPGATERRRRRRRPPGAGTGGGDGGGGGGGDQPRGGGGGGEHSSALGLGLLHAEVRAAAASHPLFDTRALTRALEERVGSLLLTRRG